MLFRSQSGLTLIPTTLYFKDGKVKVEIGLAKGKKAHDKRASLMEKQADREIEREMSRNISGKSSNRAPSRGKYSDYDD